MSEQPVAGRPVPDQPAEQPSERLSEQLDDVAASDPRIAAAIDRLDSLAERPPAEHVEIYEEVHAVLQESLAEAQGDQEQQPGGAAR